MKSQDMTRKFLLEVIQRTHLEPYGANQATATLSQLAQGSPDICGMSFGEIESRFLGALRQHERRTDEKSNMG